MSVISPIRFSSRAALLLACAAGALSAAHAQEPVADEDGTITVTGRRISQSAEAIGEDKVSNVVAVTREALLSAPSGISGLKMLEQLPGFNVQTDGALGLYEFGNSVQTRAFNLDQIGFVVDGIPTGRSDAFGGSPVFRYVDNENLGVVEAAVGAGDVGLPSYSTLGPVVQYNSIAPQEDLGLFVSQSFGDFGMKRTFIRASTGQVGPFRAYVSRTKLNSDLWRGKGTVDREHWEGMLHADLGGDSWARFKFVSNKFNDFDSPTLSRAQYLSAIPDVGGNTGRDRGYIAVVPNTTPGFAPVTGGPAYSNANYAYTNTLAINVRDDKLYGGTVHAGIADGIWAEATAYYEDKGGYGVSPDTYANSLPIYQRQTAVGWTLFAPKGTQYGLSTVGGDRYGLTTKLHWQVGAHTLEAGVWGEVDTYNRTQARYNTTDGSPASAPNLNEPVYLRRDYQSERNTTQAFIKDRISLADDRLIFDLGVKALHIDYRHSGYRDFNDYYRNAGTATAPVWVAGWGPQTNRASYGDGFLPMAGVLYKLDNQTQVFASYAENMALPKGMDDIFSVSLNSSAAVVSAPAPERSQNFEAGIRTNQGQFYASLAGYYTKFKNRIQSIGSILPGTTNVIETFYQNVGRVTAYGAEFSGTFKPSALNGLAYFNLNATYNIAKFKDDIVTNTATGTLVYQTDGKYIPDSAKWIVSGGVTIEPASWLVGNFSGKYTSRRWSTFDNSGPTVTNPAGSSVPGFTVFSAYVDIGDGFSLGPIKSVKARFNVDNIFDKDTLSYISPAVTGDGSFRPLSPRTFQFTISGEI
ncbi:TonB-dependent receptor [Sphingobium sp. BYY-5]|uniref:TonB-dependent receptor n=1 Tax=Sphingobium sp. BYY-5 TaxID=2926400 RepID=UPI001FA7EEEC|nr:TonB-dependent receptor [Sphingobium sp. BYY-5]MCI4589737.1 TonB-dependent receptor [Sphingobium sp. BYY-5]